MTVAQIRGLLGLGGRAMEDVLCIENLCFASPWSEEEFISCLIPWNVIGMVAEVEGQVAGFAVYELRNNSLQLLRIAVHPRWQGEGVGSALMCELTGKLSAERWNQIALYVRETNYPAQMFFKSIGFIATEVISWLYDDTSEDAYRFIFRHEWALGAAV